MKINKKIILTFLLLISMISLFLLNHKYNGNAADDAAYIKDITTTIKDGVVTCTGETYGQTDGMNIAIKVIDADGKLEYFNQGIIHDNDISFSFVPANASEESTLKLIILGDLSFTKEIYYSSTYADSDEVIEEKIQTVLDTYATYKDANVTLKFKGTITYSSTNTIIDFKGTNFKKSEYLWTERETDVFDSYIKTLYTKIKAITNNTVTINYYDKSNNLLGTYPSTSSGSSEETDTSKILSYISNYTYFVSNKTNFTWTISQNSKTTANYIVIDYVSSFEKSSTVWSKLDKSDMKTFATKIADILNKYYNADIQINFYYSNKTVLDSYEFYYYEKDGNTNDSSNEYIPIDTSKPTGLVLMLSLTDYGTNSAKITPVIEEGLINNKYTTTIKLSDYSTVNKELSNLRKDSQKIIVIPCSTESGNINLTVTSNIITALKTNKALLIFDCNNYRIELDCSNLKASGVLTISSEDGSDTKNTFSTPVTLNIKIGSTDATKCFENGVTCMIHYDTDKTDTIEDLRTINVYNEDIMLNTTASTLVKGFIFKYNGNLLYTAKNNEYTFKDIKDSQISRYAKLVSSKEILDINSNYFKPNTEITRGVLLNYISHKIGITSTTNNFTDITTSNKYYKEINGCYEAGVLPSTWTGTIKSSTIVKRQELIYIIMRVYEINENNKKITSTSLIFKDKANIATWAKTTISKAVKLGLINSDGYLKPNANITNGEVVELLYKLFEKEGIF